MSDVTGNVPVQWLPAGRVVEFAVTVTVGEPPPGAQICYTATQPLRGETLRP